MYPIIFYFDGKLILINWKIEKYILILTEMFVIMHIFMLGPIF